MTPCILFVIKNLLQWLIKLFQDLNVLQSGTDLIYILVVAFTSTLVAKTYSHDSVVRTSLVIYVQQVKVLMTLKYGRS